VSGCRLKSRPSRPTHRATLAAVKSYRGRVGTFSCSRAFWRQDLDLAEAAMHGIFYIVGLIVVILAILSFFGLR
jgi:hypothetical protein